MFSTLSLRLALLPLLLASSSLRAQVSITEIARADNASGATTLLTELEPAAISGGNVAHRMRLREGQFNSRIGIYVNGATALLNGDLAPGTGSTFSGINPKIFVNAGGQIAFVANTNDNSNFGFWAGSPGALQLVARDGSPAPGTNGDFALGYPGLERGSISAFNDAGQIAFSAAIAGAPNASSSGLWMGAPGALQLVARLGSQAEGFPNGVSWTYLEAQRLNAAGQVAFRGIVSQALPPGTYDSSYSAFMVGAPGALQVAAHSGQRAPGIEEERYFKFNTFGYALNSKGEVAFNAYVGPRLGDIGKEYEDVLYAGAPGALQLVARYGQPAPGGEADLKFGGFREPAINAAGEVAVIAGLYRTSGPSSDGIYVGKPGRLRLIARTGDVAPGTGGQVFADFPDDANHGEVFLSDTGQVAFKAYIAASVGGGTTDAIFATDKAGALHLVARAGTSINGGPIFRNLETDGDGLTYAAGNGDGQRTVLDAQGRLIFYGVTNDPSYQQFIYRATFPESAPVILAQGQPRPVGAVSGGSATFDVSALNSQPATYQWRFNGADIAGATSSTLTLSNLTMDNRGAYTVLVTNAQGATESAPAQLFFPPAITQGPQNQNVNAGTTATLGVTTAGPGPLTYQWQFKATGAADFTNLAGATGATLSLPNIATNQAGRYRVAVTNSDATETSSEAVVTVAAAGAPIITRLFVSGDPVPGISNSVTFSRVEDAVLNDEGEIAFEGTLAGDTSGGTNGTYFRSVDGQYRFVTWQAFNLNLSDSGELAQVNSRPITTIEHGTPGNMQALARRNNTAPGGAGSYNLDGSFNLDDSGTAAFRFDTDPYGTAIFIGKPGAVSLLARKGQAAPGLAEGVVFDFVLEPVINPAGTAAFWAQLQGPGITADNDTGIWTGTAAGVQRVVAEDDFVPAAGNGVRVGNIRTPDTRTSPFGWNAAGQVAFQTTLAGPGITDANDKAILAGAPGALAVVAREGAAMSGHTFSFASPAAYPLINRVGQVAFVATVTPTGTTNFWESLWLWTPGANGGTRKLIAREGQQAPGMPAGVVFDSDAIGRPVFSCSLNGAGQLLVTCFVAGPGISFDAGNSAVVYLTTPTGEMMLVTREGAPFDIGGGEMRVPTYIPLALRSGGEDGRPRALSEDGTVVMAASINKANGAYGDCGLFLARLPGTGGGTGSAPNATAQAPTAITQTGATLQASVNPNGVATSVRFEYGTTTAYGQSTPAQSIASDSAAVPVSATISGLAANTTYHFRVVATNAGGTTNGNDLTFTTTTGGGSNTGDFTLMLTGVKTGAVISPTATFRALATPSFPSGSKTKITSVQLMVDGEPEGAPGTKSKYSFKAQVTEAGPHILTAVATDTGGKTVVSNAIPFTVAEAGAGPIALGLSVTPSDGTAAPGELIAYTLTGTNSTNMDVSNVELTLLIPIGAGFVAADFVDANGDGVPAPKKSRVSFNGANGTVTISIQEVKAFASFSLRLRVRVPYDQTTAGNVITNSSFAITAVQGKTKITGSFPTRSLTVAGSLPDGAPRPVLGLFVSQVGAGVLPTDESAVTVTTEMLGVPDALPKRKSNEITYRVNFFNMGTAPAHSVRVVTPIPPGTSFNAKRNPPRVVSAQGDSVPVSSAEFGNLLFFDVPRLEPNFFDGNPGSSKTLEYTVRVDKTLPLGTNVVHLGAAVTSGELLQPVTYQYAQTARVVAPAQMRYTGSRAFVRASANQPADSGAGFVYHTIFFHNQGDLTAKEVGIRYTVPPGLAFQDAYFSNATNLDVVLPVKKGQEVTKPAVNAASGEVVFTVGTVKHGDFGFARVKLKQDAATRPDEEQSKGLFVGYDSTTVGARTAVRAERTAARAPKPTYPIVGEINERHYDPGLPRPFIMHAGPASVAAGGEIEYQVTWGNMGEVSSGLNHTGFQIPAGTEFVSATATSVFGGTSVPNDPAPAVRVFNPGDNGPVVVAVLWDNTAEAHSMHTATVKVRVLPGVTGQVVSGDEDHHVRIETGFFQRLYSPAIVTRILAPGERAEDRQAEIYSASVGQGDNLSLGRAGAPAGKFLENIKQITSSSRTIGIAGADFVHLAGNDAIAIPLGGGNLVAAGGGNFVNPSTAGLVAAGGGNLVAAGGGNLQIEVPGRGFVGSAQLIRDVPSLVAAGGMNLVAAGGMNLVRKAADLVGNDGSTLVGNDGASLVGLDGATLGSFSQRTGIAASFAPFTGSGLSSATFTNNAASLVAAGGGNLVAAGGGNFIGLGASNIIPPASLVGNDGASLVGNDGSTLIPQGGVPLVGNDGASLVGNDGSTLVGNDGASLVAAGGGNFVTGSAGFAPR